jgi:hypothetical protein
MRDEPATRIDRIVSRVRNNPIVATLMVLAAVVVGLSTFTNAARNLWAVVGPTEARPAINGEWVADVSYDWQNARYAESFRFSGDSDTLSGLASYLGTPRGIVEGKARKGSVQFSTRSREAMGGTEKEAVHHYQGRVQGDEIRFVVQTDGGFSEHVPVEFTARRLGASGASVAR